MDYLERQNTLSYTAVLGLYIKAVWQLEDSEHNNILHENPPRTPARRCEAFEKSLISLLTSSAYPFQFTPVEFPTQRHALTAFESFVHQISIELAYNTSSGEELTVLDPKASLFGAAVAAGTGFVSSEKLREEQKKTDNEIDEIVEHIQRFTPSDPAPPLHKARPQSPAHPPRSTNPDLTHSTPHLTS